MAEMPREQIIDNKLGASELHALRSIPCPECGKNDLHIKLVTSMLMLDAKPALSGEQYKVTASMNAVVYLSCGSCDYQKAASK
jgi:hypothetical protein